MIEKTSSTRWFGMALQALIVLSDYEGLCPSEKIAKRLESQSTSLRKVLTHLVKGGMIQAKEGRDGGYFLIKDPEDITLAEIYDVMKAGPFTKDFLCVEGKECFIPATRDALIELRNEMEHQIIEGLRKKTLADLLMK